ncbi:CaiB/BaiF CoA transferase family protein [Psychrobacillus soli]|uniref:CoA transferase n=1 Tax=Psychrobacillus soli TaxID=1543965 RepID=A0A544TM46_9BACI|nr:CaiB/BaiF CoA-transferase family protein [Psychrobacillus soli]TQR18523.1 CoA transferase [Psychrobacillus soli]
MPLRDIKVLDLSRLLPGPYCTMILADFGAEVIKIEEPEIGDYLRQYEPKIDTESASFHSLNCNKKSVCLDLKDSHSREKFLELVKEADILVESFRPGVMKKLDLAYEELKKVNPALIYCAITGYGQDGPYAKRPGHDLNYLSYAGLLSLMGEKGKTPIVPSAQIADIGGGAMPAVIGILLALLERSKSGEGQMVDISMLDGVLSWMHLIMPAHYTGQEIKRGESLLNGGYACYQVYETSDNRYLSVGAIEPKFWRVFCEAIGKPVFIQRQNDEEDKQPALIVEVQNILRQKTSDEWMEIFAELDACVTPVLNLDELDSNPQIQHRAMLQNVAYGPSSSIKRIASPIKLSRTPAIAKSKAPKLGEHTMEFVKN